MRNQKKVEEKKEEEKEENKNKGFTISEPAPREEEVVDVQERYDQLVDSGATAISSDMMFKKESEGVYGRNSQPE